MQTSWLKQYPITMTLTASDIVLQWPDPCLQADPLLEPRPHVGSSHLSSALLKHLTMLGLGHGL